MYKFRIENMNCMSCFHNIEDSLREFDSSIRVKAEIKNHLLMVDSGQTVELLQKVIQAAGYSVDEVTQD